MSRRTEGCRRVTQEEAWRILDKLSWLLDEAKTPRRTRRARKLSFLTREETERFFAAIPKDATRDRLTFDLLYHYGLRRREGSNLLEENVLADRLWIERVKGGVSGWYPLFPSTRRLLDEYLPTKDRENPYLLTTRLRHRSMGTGTTWTLFRRYAKLAGLPETLQHPHVLRHSIAVHLMNAGWDIADVQDWLGHADIGSTTIYAQVTNRRR